MHCIIHFLYICLIIINKQTFTIMNKKTFFQALSILWFFGTIIFALIDSTDRKIIDDNFFLYNFLLSGLTLSYSIFINTQSHKI